MHWKKSAIETAAATAIFELVLMLAFKFAPMPAENTFAGAWVDALLLSGAVGAFLLLRKRAAAGKWASLHGSDYGDIAAIAIAIAAYEVALHPIAQIMTSALPPLTVDIFDALAVATAAGAVAAWVHAAKNQVRRAELKTLTYLRTTGPAVLIGATFVVLATVSMSLLDRIHVNFGNHASKGQSTLLDLSGRQGMLSQRIGRLALMPDPNKRELQLLVRNAAWEASEMHKLSALFADRNALDSATRRQLPGNAIEETARQRYLALAREVSQSRLHNQTTGLELQQSIDAFLPIMEKSTTSLENILEARLSRLDGNHLNWAFGFLLLLLGAAMLWPLLRIFASQQYELSEALKTSQKSLATLKMYQAALDAHAIVGITDRHGKITFANEKFCAISKYSREELIGQNHRMLNSGTHPYEMFAHMWRTISKGNVWNSEICNRAKDGTLYWVDTTVIPLIGEDGRPDSYVSIRYDCTQRYQAQQDLACALDHLQEERIMLERRVRERTIEIENAMLIAQRASKAKSSFLSVMSHELRTPLQTITSYAEFIKESLADEGISQVDKELDTILMASTHLRNLIGDVLDHSKIESGEMTASAQPFDISDLLSEVSILIQPTIEKNGNIFQREWTDKLGMANTDRVKLKQCALNLLSNAAKFTKNGCVKLYAGVSIIESKPHLTLSVTDTGVGMSQEQAANLFRPFYQVDTSETRSVEGTGLGLSITKRLSELMGGTAKVDTRKGAGSTFTICIPTTLPSSESKLQAAAA